jgi:hypothetical protein
VHWASILGQAGNIGTILAISANIANFTMALSAVLTIIVNRKFLPKEFRGSAFRDVVLILNLVFFGFFFTLFLLSRFGFKF